MEAESILTSGASKIFSQQKYFRDFRSKSDAESWIFPVDLVDLAHSTKN